MSQFTPVRGGVGEAPGGSESQTTARLSPLADLLKGSGDMHSLLRDSWVVASGNISEWISGLSQRNQGFKRSLWTRCGGKDVKGVTLSFLCSQGINKG